MATEVRLVTMGDMSIGVPRGRAATHRPITGAGKKNCGAGNGAMLIDREPDSVNQPVLNGGMTHGGPTAAVPRFLLLAGQVPERSGGETRGEAKRGRDDGRARRPPSRTDHLLGSRHVAAGVMVGPSCGRRRCVDP